MGFFMQAKTQVVGLSIPNIIYGAKAFPESVLVSLFFVVFGIVIAFLKDVPDIKGDKEFNIPSLSVKYGAKSIFRYVDTSHQSYIHLLLIFICMYVCIISNV
jgi:4-hydroxybenzoate polyprenyltransferase